MIYKDFRGMKLSALGMGAMRLPVIDGDDGKIDEQASFAMVDKAYESGVNYYDTAWGYHKEQSEIVMGKALKKYPRDSFYVATKFPGYDAANWDKVEEIFEKQLEKLQMDYFDFYLVHNVNEANIDAYLDEEKYGIHEYLLKQVENGRIKHLGFSTHGSLEIMERYLEKYGKYMEFCQIQLNYIDYKLQDAKAKIELLNKYNIPVWVMEPLRGGKLCKLAEEDVAILKEKRDVTDTEWAFRWLQSIPEVVVTLSGMSNMEQMVQNIETYQEEKPLNSEEMEAIGQVVDHMLSKGTLPCTGCNYCITHCPQELPIPEIMALYNEHAFTGGGFMAPMVLGTFDEDKRPSACVGCGSCEEVCPQQIKISEMMSDFVKRLEAK